MKDGRPKGKGKERKNIYIELF